MAECASSESRISCCSDSAIVRRLTVARFDSQVTVTPDNYRSHDCTDLSAECGQRVWTGVSRNFCRPSLISVHRKWSAFRPGSKLGIALNQVSQPFGTHWIPITLQILASFGSANSTPSCWIKSSFNSFKNLLIKPYIL